MTAAAVRLPFWTRRVLVRALRRPPRGHRRPAVLLVGLALIVVWQHDFFRRAKLLESGYSIQEASGMNDEWRFVYFLYYLGLYPVVSSEGHVRSLGDPGYKKFGRAAAEHVVAERGETLVMEFGDTIRAGDHGRALLYLPNAIWTGSAREPCLAPTHSAFFTLALGALYAAFWRVRDPVLGAFAVALLGSNPFQLYAVHAQENVWGWPMTAGILTLALCLPLLARRPPPRLSWLIAPAAGALLASVRQIRAEPVTMLASAVAACLLLSGASWRRRAALALLVVTGFFATSSLWQAWFDHKFEEARRVIAAAGGTAYRGPLHRYHTFWHPLWCGLGDFDKEYGYTWNDKAARAFAVPLMESRYGRTPDQRYLYWDPVYDRVLREKIVHDITHDPLWYAGILARRVARVLTWTTPVRLAVDGWRADLPWNGLAALPLVVVLLWTRSWPLLKLALFPLGTSLPAVLVFSGTVPGQTYTGWFHVVGAAIVAAVVIDCALPLSRRALLAVRSPAVGSRA